jgi:hypothetical protein
MVQTLALLLLLVLVAFPIWAIVKIVSLSGQNNALADRLREIEEKLDALRRPEPSSPARDRVEPPTPAVPVMPLAAQPPPAREMPAPAPVPPPPIVVPPPLPMPMPPPLPAAEPPPILAAPIASTEPESAPPPLIAATPPIESDAPIPDTADRPSPVAALVRKIDWEQFTGAKLLAWIGGLLAFLGLAFFVKYSFEHGWVSPELRATLGFLFGAGLVVGGLKIKRDRYAVTAQTLIATGIVSLYAVTFACNAIYKFEVFEQHAILPFALMSLITVTAFLLAVRLDARVVAVLGILGGFLTPPLLATGHDNPAGLFGYIALLDLGLIAVALHRRWNFLVPLGAAGTIVMQIGWAGKFFADDPSGKSGVAMIVSLAFSALFLGATIVARRRARGSPELLWSAIALPCVCFGFAMFFLGYPVVAARIGFLFSLVLLADLCLLALAWLEGKRQLVALAAAGTGLLLAAWMARIFTAERAPILMAIVVGFGAVFLAAHLIARRLQRSSLETLWSAAALPLLAFTFSLVFLGHATVAERLWLLFGFVLLADAGLLALAWLESKPLFVALAVIGTGLVESGWIFTTLTPANATAFMVVTLGFCALFLVTHLVARRSDRAGPESMWSAVALPFVAFGFGFVFLSDPAIAARPGLLFTFILLADAGLLTLAWCDENLPKLHLAAGIAVFALLAAWTGGRLTAVLLPWALTFYLLHAVLHTAFPLVLERHRPAAAPTWWSQLFPPLALLLMLGPLFKLEAVSLAFWPCVLLVDLLAIGLAVVTASLAAVAIVLVLTLGATGLWMFHVPATIAASTPLLLVIGGFALLFFAAGIFLSRRFADKLTGAKPILSGALGDPRAQIPAFSALLPFLLLIMMTQRLPLANPSPAFGLALLLVVLVLGLSRLLALEWLPACALAGAAALEYAWHARLFAPDHAAIALAWYVVFYAVFTLYPFVFRRTFLGLTGPWAIAALGGVVQFPLVYRVAQAMQTNQPPNNLGLLPALFAVAPLASLFVVLRGSAVSDRTRLNQLAWFGGVALLFITLIFPIQFDRQWLTLGWALEGAALLWLFHRVPHNGLRATGVVLLIAAFTRLALNPAVLEYHARSGTALLNWFLYSYGVVTLSLFAGARLLAPPRERVLGSNAPVLLNTLGTVLAFLLVNLEIADFFSAPGTRVLTFQFSGNFGRDMSYTIAWALFALVLLLISLGRGVRAGRYAALALLGVALLKLFFHDLAQLEALYRIGVLFAVAVIAIVASVAYQRFLPSNDHTTPDKS